MPRREDMHRGRITDYTARDMRDPVQLRRAMDDYIGRSGIYDRDTRRDMVERVAKQAEASIAANDQAGSATPRPHSARSRDGGRSAFDLYSRILKY